MNKKLPFEEAFERQMNDLPLQDENDSWQKMKNLLDNKDKRKPMSFFKTYGTAAVLLLLLLAGVWLLISPNNIKNEKPVAVAENNAASQPKPLPKPARQSVKKNQISKPAVIDSLPASIYSDDKLPAQITSVVSAEKSTSGQNTKLAATKSKTSIVKSLTKEKSNSRKFATSKTGVAGLKPGALAKDNPGKTGKTSQAGKNETSTDTAFIHLQSKPDSVIAHNSDTTLFKEAVTAKDTVTVQKTPVIRMKKYLISSGFGVQQQIPVAGQHVVRYGYNANSTLSDYIPSVYFRFEREQQWFLQAEFIYGAPQLVNNLAYSRLTKADSSGAVTTTTMRLKKTFYSRLPLSFNYCLRPNFSVGLGATYSWLHGAIAEKEISTKAAPTPTTNVVKQIVPIAGFTDSFLYRSHTHVLLQADYQWRRLSLGLRYTKDVQPYIKYTLPDGAIADQKNWSLEFILRLRLWKSRLW